MRADQPFLDDATHPFFIRVQLNDDGGQALFDRATGALSRRMPPCFDTACGILADEMGLGKRYMDVCV
jgi:hypothetical protein